MNPLDQLFAGSFDSSSLDWSSPWLLSGIAIAGILLVLKFRED